MLPAFSSVSWVEVREVLGVGLVTVVRRFSLAGRHGLLEEQEDQNRHSTPAVLAFCILGRDHH